MFPGIDNNQMANLLDVVRLQQTELAQLRGFVYAICQILVEENVPDVLERIKNHSSNFSFQVKGTRSCIDALETVAAQLRAMNVNHPRLPN